MSGETIAYSLPFGKSDEQRLREAVDRFVAARQACNEHGFNVRKFNERQSRRQLNEEERSSFFVETVKWANALAELSAARYSLTLLLGW